MLLLLSDKPGFTCRISFAQVFSFIYYWVLIFALSHLCIFMYMFLGELGVFHANQIDVSWSTSELRVRLALWNRFKVSSKIFLLTVPKRYFFCGSFMLFLSCVWYVFVRVCLLMPCGHLLGKGWPLGSCLWCLIVSLSLFHWYPGSVWYLIVSIPALCTLSYFFKFFERIKENGVCCPWTIKETKHINILYFQPQRLIPEVLLQTCYTCLIKLTGQIH